MDMIRKHLLCAAALPAVLLPAGGGASPVSAEEVKEETARAVSGADTADGPD